MLSFRSTDATPRSTEQPPQYWCYPHTCTDAIPPQHWTASAVLNRRYMGCYKVICPFVVLPHKPRFQTENWIRAIYQNFLKFPINLIVSVNFVQICFLKIFCWFFIFPKIFPSTHLEFSDKWMVYEFTLSTFPIFYWSQNLSENFNTINERTCAGRRALSFPIISQSGKLFISLWGT